MHQPNITLVSSHERGNTTLAWLKSYHSFSFGHYRNPKRMGFSDLLVLNDDTVKPSAGFGMHSHANMEIITLVLSGALAHKDSLNHQQTLLPGQLQVMSAGTGIAHSEFNPSDTTPVHFLQIWIKPANHHQNPTYQQKNIDYANPSQGLTDLHIHANMPYLYPLASNTSDTPFFINQSASIYLFDPSKLPRPMDPTLTPQMTLAPKRNYYFYVASGHLTLHFDCQNQHIQTHTITKGSAICIDQLRSLASIQMTDIDPDTSLLLFDLNPT